MVERIIAIIPVAMGAYVGAAGAPPQAAPDERLAEEIQRAQRYGEALSLILLDLDHFTRINDSAGHAVGDAVLCAVAALLTAQARQTDLVARRG